MPNYETIKAGIEAPYLALLTKLREPVDEGGHDGRHSDPLHVSAASAIEALSTGLASQIDICNGLRAEPSALCDSHAELQRQLEDLQRWHKIAQAMGLRMFRAGKALRSIALNHAEAARSGVVAALDAIDGAAEESEVVELAELQRQNAELLAGLQDARKALHEAAYFLSFKPASKDIENALIQCCEGRENADDLIAKYGGKQ